MNAIWMEMMISLTPTEFTILQALCEAKAGYFSAEELFHIIWKDEYYSKSNNTIIRSHPASAGET